MKGNIFHHSFYSMGTRFSLLFIHPDELLCEKYAGIITAEVKRVEEKLSYFSGSSDITYINKYAFEREIMLDGEIFYLLKKCDEYNLITEGAFDITMRSIIESRKSNQSADLDGISWQNSVHLTDDQKIKFNSSIVKIDLGSLGKGYALEKAESILHSSPINNIFISFGESSILAMGNHPNGSSWQVGINDLMDNGSSIYNFDLVDASVSTSSNYTADDLGQISLNINVVDPAKKEIIDEIKSVSVRSRSPLQAEILSTAFLTMKEEKIKIVVDRLKDVSAVQIDYAPQKKITIYESLPHQSAD